MRWVRQIIGDRLSGGVLAALTGYLLVLQVLMTGFACGSTVTLQPDAGVRFVICHPSDVVGASSDDGTTQDSQGHRCPCAVCHMADPTLLAALPQGSDLGPAFARAEMAVPLPQRVADPLPTPHLLGLARDTRGPPHASA
ncbi:hypothetical protein [Aureimonas altamirensis]|uniref:hypothetical protein n=1 Tax=Aureimonas altamirensis TaxID=370622 RepID=UPI0030190936